MIARLVSYLLVTWLVEFGVVWTFLRYRKEQRTVVSLLRDTFLVNALTNPLLNYARLTWGISVWAGEVTVVAIEIPLYGLLLGLTPRQAVGLSLLANATSFALGPCVEFVFG